MYANWKPETTSRPLEYAGAHRDGCLVRRGVVREMQGEEAAGIFLQVGGGFKTQADDAYLELHFDQFGVELAHQMVVNEHAVEFLELVVVVVIAQLESGLLGALADAVEFGGRLFVVGQRGGGGQSEGGEHHLLEPEFGGEGQTLVELLLELVELVVAAFAAQPRALDGAAHLRGGEPGQRAQVRVARRRTHFDGLEADAGERVQRALEIFGQCFAHRPDLGSDRHAQRVGVQCQCRGSRGRGAEELPSVEIHTDSGLQPLRYSRERYLLASATLVILRLAASWYKRWRVRSATAYRFTASEIPPACRKLPSDCAPPLQAAAHWRSPGESCPGWRGTGWGGEVWTMALGFFQRCMSWGFSTRKPARILPLSPTNIMASAGNSLRSSSNSGGVGGRMPPSYQIRSTAPRWPRAGYWKRTTLAEGKAKSFFTPEATPSVST